MNKLLNYSFLEKSNSSGWKGILILLVVLGHNSILCKPSIEADHSIFGDLGYIHFMFGLFSFCHSYMDVKN